MKISHSVERHALGRIPRCFGVRGRDLMKPRFVCLLLLLASSCRTSVAPAPFVGDPDSRPTNAEIVAYLDGKILPVPKPGSDPLTIRLDGIEALSVERRGVQIDDGGWSTEISLIYNSSRARYDVMAAVEHRVIDGQRVISALRIQHVTRRH